MSNRIALPIHCIWVMLIMMCMNQSSVTPAATQTQVSPTQQQQPSPDYAYRYLKSQYPEFVPHFTSQQNELQFEQQLQDFYTFAKNARIYVIQYRPQELPIARMQQCFRPQTTASQAAIIPDDASFDCETMRQQILEQEPVRISISKQGIRPSIVIFQTDAPAVFEFEGITKNMQMILFSGYSPSHIESSQFNSSNSLGMYRHNYAPESCELSLCSDTPIDYFMQHKSEERVQRAVQAYFNRKPHQIIILHEPQRVILQ